MIRVVQAKKNEILKEAKNAEKLMKNHILDRKMSFLSVFSLFRNFIVQLAQPLSYLVRYLIAVNNENHLAQIYARGRLGVNARTFIFTHNLVHTT